MNTIETIKERYQQLQSNNGSSVLTPIEQHAFNTFNTFRFANYMNDELVAEVVKENDPN